MLFTFKPQADLVFRILLIGLVGLPVAGLVIGEVWKWASYETDVGVVVSQPVPFSHKHHVGQLGMDCRYCHTSVETSASAGMPAMHTCMTCHSQIWTGAAVLKPVRDSIETGKPVEWNRVYRIPGYVYFNHSIHIHSGVKCTTCHGEIAQMPLTMKARTFYMRDCLSCHRQPEKFNLHEAGVQKRLTDCSTCHR